MKYLDTIKRRILADPNTDVPDFFRPLLQRWRQHKTEAEDAFPHYGRFDVLDIPPRLFSHLILCKLIGTPRRFFYEVVGEAIESHNGFPAAKRFLADVPLKNKKVMAREFGLTVFKRSAIFSRGPYIGQYDYVKEIERLICPYRIEGETFAFVTLARFTLDEAAMRDATLRVDRLMGVGLHKPA